MGFLIQLCQHSSDTTDLFLPRNSKSFLDISVTELICFLTFNESKSCDIWGPVLKLKATKCEFFKSQVVYLGHVVSEAGIQGDPAKIEAVRNWPVPKTVKEVRQFLGFTGYYRRFVKGFAALARPLNDLLVGLDTNPKASKKRKTCKKQALFE